MKKIMKMIGISAMVVTIGATGVVAFADSSSKTPVEALAGITGKTVESLTSERNETNKSYGTIAKESGKLEEFQKELLHIKKAALDEQVKAGTLTQEKADAILKEIEDNQANCDGTGNAKIGQKYGMKFGSQSSERGNHNHGAGLGQGRGNGNCMNQ